MTARILVAGVGNVFCGDDGFGVAVIAALRSRPARAGVSLMDAGIRTLDLGYALLDGWDAVLFVDAAPRGHAPGTLSVIEPAPAVGEAASFPPPIAHGLGLEQVLASALASGARLGAVRIVACEPASLGPEEGALGLSPEVERAVPEGARLVEELVAELGAEVGDA